MLDIAEFYEIWEERRKAQEEKERSLLPPLLPGEDEETLRLRMIWRSCEAELTRREVLGC